MEQNDNFDIFSKLCSDIFENFEICRGFDVCRSMIEGYLLVISSELLHDCLEDDNRIIDEFCNVIIVMSVTALLGERKNLLSVYESKPNVLILPNQICPSQLSVILRNYREKLDAIEQVRILDIISEQSMNTIIITDNTGNIEYTNRHFQRLSGFSSSELIGNNPSILKSGIHTDEFYNNLWEKLESKNVWEGIFVNRTKTGLLFYEEANISAICDINGNITGYLKIGKNVEREKMHHIELNEEMKIAREIMINMIPQTYDDENLTYKRMIKPFNYLGGDFLIFEKLSSSIYRVGMIDVMGHGISSAIVGLRMTALVQAIGKYLSLDELVDKINLLMCENNTLNQEIRKYASAVFIEFDFNSNSMSYINAGHPPFLIKLDGTVEFVEKYDLLLGVNDNHLYKKTEIALDRIDNVFIYSDGLIDSYQKMMLDPLSELKNLYQSLNKGHRTLLRDIVNEATSEHGVVDDVALCRVIVK